jgi:FKBP-type peptidyl-prolyl cis-trans isomerase SlpA
LSDTERQIGPGATVTLHFGITLEDGTVAESSWDNEPFQCIIGDGTLVEGLEQAVYGLQAGDRQRLTLSPEQAFGGRDATKVHVLERSLFEPGQELAAGMIIGFTTPSGEEIPGAVSAVDGEQVTVDFNHPLAGHAIRFDVEVLAVVFAPR